MGAVVRSGSVAYVGLEDSVEPSSSELSWPDSAESDAPEECAAGGSGICRCEGGANTRAVSTAITWSSITISGVSPLMSLFWISMTKSLREE